MAPIPKKCVFSIVCIGYKGETPYYSVKRINHNTRSESIELEPKETTCDLLRQSLAVLNTSSSFNSIEKDQAYMKAFFKENQRRKEKEKERLFMQRLFFMAYPCAPALQ